MNKLMHRVDPNLILDSETSIVLPYFDTSSIVNSNIESITLSLFVLEKTPRGLTKTRIMINPVDLNTGETKDGLSTFVSVEKGNYIDFRLPKELFEQTIKTQKRLLVGLVSKGQRLVLAGPDAIGTTQDPIMTIEHGKLIESEYPDEPRIKENEYYNIKSAQFHFGSGDNITGDKINTQNNKKWHEIWWIKYIIFPLMVLLIGTFLVIRLGWN